MKSYDFFEFQRMIRARKAVHGIMNTEAAIDAMRNIGANRSDAKREALEAAARRAACAGVPPVKANF